MELSKSLTFLIRLDAVAFARKSSNSVGCSTAFGGAEYVYLFTHAGDGMLTLANPEPQCDAPNAFLAKRQDFKLEIGFATRLLAKRSRSTMLARDLTGRTAISPPRQLMPTKSSGMRAPCKVREKSDQPPMHTEICSVGKRTPSNAWPVACAFTRNYRFQVRMPKGT